MRLEFFMKKLLYVAYSFPPRPGVGSLRTKGIAKYLPEFGWQPIILTAALPGKPDPRYRVIETDYGGDTSQRISRKLGLNPSKKLLDQVPLSAKTLQSDSPFFNGVRDFVAGILIYPDEEEGWYSYAVEAAKKIIQQEPVDAILSCSAPVTSHIIASHLRQTSNIPWVADFRDLWSATHLHSYDPIRKWRTLRLEKKIMAPADALVTVSVPLANKLKSLHQQKPVYSITNGFDPEDGRKLPLTKKFSITHTGTIYNHYNSENLALFFKAIVELIQEKKVDKGKIEIRLIGKRRDWIDDIIKRNGLQGCASQQGEISRELSLNRQAESQILFNLLWSDTTEKGLYSAKIFEYLLAKRPILAVGGERDVLSELLEETEAGVHLMTLDTIKQFLFDSYSSFIKTGVVEYKGKEHEIMKYSHREMAKKFAAVLDGLLL